MNRREKKNSWSCHYPWSQSCKIDWIFSNYGSNGLHLTWSSLGHSEMFASRRVFLWSMFAHLNQNRNMLGWILSSCWSKKKVNRSPWVFCAALALSQGGADPRSPLGYRRAYTVHVSWPGCYPMTYFAYFYIYVSLRLSARGSNRRIFWDNIPV